jgi:hypothetical protein
MMRKKPMLAYPVNGKPVNYEDKIFVQPKLDGVRCVIQANQVNHFSRPIEYEVKAYSPYTRTIATFLQKVSSHYIRW